MPVIVNARVTIVDSEGGSARACPRHGVAALDGIASAHVGWADSKASTSGKAEPWNCPRSGAGW